MIANMLLQWLAGLGKKLYIEPGLPWENGYWVHFGGKPSDECSNGWIFCICNTHRPHSALGYRPPDHAPS